MAIEIELKARLEEIEPVKDRLSQFGVFLNSFEKFDNYWTVEKEGTLFSLRVRREKTMSGSQVKETVLATYKQKEIIDGMEINNEKEFIVSDAGVFEEFLNCLGMKPEIKKEKRGWAWYIPEASQPPVLAELLMVKDLGWFIELEILAENRGREIIDTSRKRLLVLLEKLGIAPEKIEERPYSMMLRNTQNPGILSAGGQ